MNDYETNDNFESIILTGTTESVITRDNIGVVVTTDEDGLEVLTVYLIDPTTKDFKLDGNGNRIEVTRDGFVAVRTSVDDGTVVISGDGATEVDIYFDRIENLLTLETDDVNNGIVDDSIVVKIEGETKSNIENFSSPPNSASFSKTANISCFD